MRRTSALRVIRMKRPDPMTMCLLLLIVCFLLGGIFGYLYARSCDVSEQDEFRRFLSDCCMCFEQTGVSISMGRTILLYFGMVCITFLFGYSSLGAIAIPLFSAGIGFTSFYTVICFVRAFGKMGVVMAAALTGIRMLFTLPCFLLIAGEALSRSLCLASLVLGRKKVSGQMLTGGRYLMLFVLCFICLCVGVICERLLTPILFRAVIDGLKRIL